MTSTPKYQWLCRRTGFVFGLSVSIPPAVLRPCSSADIHCSFDIDKFCFICASSHRTSNKSCREWAVLFIPTTTKVVGTQRISSRASGADFPQYCISIRAISHSSAFDKQLHWRTAGPSPFSTSNEPRPHRTPILFRPATARACPIVTFTYTISPRSHSAASCNAIDKSLPLAGFFFSPGSGTWPASGCT